MLFYLKIVMFLNKEKIQTFFSYFLRFNINSEIHESFYLPPFSLQQKLHVSLSAVNIPSC